MINNQHIKSGADLEVLLGSQYILQILNTFFESGSVPETITVGGGNSIRINSPETVEWLDEAGKDIRIDIDLDLLNPDGSVNVLFRTLTTIDAKFELVTDKTEDESLIKSLKVKINVVDFGGGIQEMIDVANDIEGSRAEREGREPALITHDFVIEELNKNLGQEYPLNIFKAGTVIRDLQVKKHADNNQEEKALGIYINLNLQKGPEAHDVFENVIQLSEAVNFLPQGKALAFGMNEEVFGRFGTNVKQTFAEEKTPGEGDWHYPLKDGKDKTIGKLSSVKLGAYKVPVLEGGVIKEWQNRNHFFVELKGEVFVDKFGVELEPDFRITIGIVPTIIDGKLEWETTLINTDIDLSFWEELKLSFTAGFLVGWVIGVFTGPLGLVLGSSITFGVGMMVTDTIADAIGESMVEGMYKDYVDASLFEAMPDRVTTITKRYDPFYWTHFQVVTLLNEVTINDNGFSFCGNATTGEDYTPVDHVVYKNEIRDGNRQIIGFDVRVRDYQAIDEAYIQFFVRRDPENHPDWFAISITEIDLRKPLKKFTSRLQFFYPWKIDSKGGSIQRILTISEKEKKEIEAVYLNPYLAERTEWFEANKKEETTEAVKKKLKKKLGRSLNEHDDKEVERRYLVKRQEWLDEEELQYRRTTLPSFYNPDAEAAVSFDMHPHEYGVLQVHGYLAMVHTYRLIYMKNRGRFYYRTKANVNTMDNLSSFPQYESPDLKEA